MLSLELTVHKNTILKHYYYCLEIRLYLIVFRVIYTNIWQSKIWEVRKKNIKIIKTIC